MHFSGLELSVVVGVPLVLTLVVWRVCRGATGWARISVGFILGMIVTLPLVRVSAAVEGFMGQWTGHYYVDALIAEILGTALPEEIGKSLVAICIANVAARGRSPLAWMICGAAAHGGFAALEGVLGSLGNEGILKVLVGRSLGSMTHICWGVIFMWFAWRGVHRAGKRWLNWAAALGLPVLLHAVTNASLVDVPGGTDINSEAVPTVMEVLIVLSGLGALVVSVAAAVICVVKGRRGEGNDQKPNAKYQGIPNVAKAVETEKEAEWV